MGMYRLVNVPTHDDGRDIVPVVEGETIYIVAAGKGETWRDGRAVLMADAFVGDHMFAKPDDLRKMYARDLALAIRLARDTGYAHAMHDLRRLIGVKAG